MLTAFIDLHSFEQTDLKSEVLLDLTDREKINLSVEQQSDEYGLSPAASFC